MKNLELLCINSVIKWQKVIQMFAIAKYERERTARESCEHGEYGSFEHLFFLFY